MVKLKSKSTEAPQAIPQSAYLTLVAKFIATWLVFMALLMFVALMLNIDWARPQVQDMMSRFFNRQVVLGKLSLTVGFNGVAIETDRMTVKDIGGGPFLHSQHGKIGVALLPLLEGKLKVRRLSFDKPELWAIRVSDKQWNFSDLIHPVDVRFIEIKQGQLHVRDNTRLPNSFPSYDFADINAKIVNPRKNHAWPFQLSFSLPRKEYVSKVKLRVFGRGELKDWQTEPYGFELISENLNRQDFGPYRKYLPPIDGLFNTHVAGQGRFARKIEANVEATVSKLSMQIENARAKAALSQAFPYSLADGSNVAANFNLPAATITGKLAINQKLLSWNSLTLKSGPSLLESRGQVSMPVSAHSHYQIWLQGKLSDLNEVSRLLSWNKASAPGWWSRFTSGPIAGKANFQLEIKDKQSAPEYQSSITIEGLPARQALAFLPSAQFTWLSPWTNDPSAKLSGQINVAYDGSVSTSGLNLTYRSSTVRFSGNWKQGDPLSQINFESDNFNLGEFSKTLLSHPKTRAQLSKWLDLPPAGQLDIRGNLNLTGRLSPFRKNNQLLVVSELKGVSVHLLNEHLLADNIRGSIMLGEQKLQMQKISGRIDGGNFSLQGTSRPGFTQPGNFKLQAAHLNLNHLLAVMKIARMKFPMLSDGQLSGRVRDLVYEANNQGKATRLSLIPESIFYTPVKTPRPLVKVSGGLVRWENNQLNVTNMELASKQSRLTLSFVINNVDAQPLLKRLHLKSAGCDLAEMHNHLSSEMVPAALKSAYVKFTNSYHLVFKQGRFYGDLTWEPQNKNTALQGTAGVYNAKVLVGPGHYLLDRVSGLMAASGQELLIQDFRGSIGHSTFVIDGHATDYQRPGLAWQMNLRSWIFSEELLTIFTDLNLPLTGQVHSDGPLSLRAHISGDDHLIQSIFSAQSPAKSNLSLITPAGSISKPSGQTLALDGSIEIQPGANGTLKVKNSHLLFDQSVVRAYGTYNWYAPEAKQENNFDFRLLTPNPIPASVLTALWSDQTLSPQGNWQGDIHLFGSPQRINLQGAVDLKDLKLAQPQISLPQGHLNISQWTMEPQADSKLSTTHFVAHLKADKASISRLSAREIDGDLNYNHSDGQNQLWLPNLTARVFSGKLNLTARGDLTRKSWRVSGDLHKADANQMLSEAFGWPGELSGSTDAAFSFESSGSEKKDILSHLNGKGTVSITGGKVTRFGYLQEKITQANLLRQGLFGFNLNNLLQSVVPVRTGRFKELSTQYRISQGSLKVSHLRFNGDDMRLWGAGEINLPQQSIDVKIAGNVPRVSSSLLRGPVGEVSKRITIQGFMKLATGGTFENLPSLPLIGEISGERPRAFSFDIAANMTKAKEVTQSIEKSFRWLPSRVNASAHPVPELQ